MMMRQFDKYSSIAITIYPECRTRCYNCHDISLSTFWRDVGGVFIQYILLNTREASKTGQSFAPARLGASGRGCAEC